MGKVTERDLPKDHPLLTGGWKVATTKKLKQATKELKKKKR